MTNKKIETKIFLVLFIFSFIFIGPYVIDKYILTKYTENIEDNTLEEYDEDIQQIYENDSNINLEENSNQISNDISNITSNLNSNSSNVVSNSNSNKISNTNSNKISNVNSNITSNKVSNKQSNKTSNTVTSNKQSNKVPTVKNTVPNPTVTFTGFKTVDSSYFDDALFIGDSRTVGIRDYGTLKNASYFCDVGMTTYNIYKKNLLVKSVGKVTIDKLLEKKKYGKIYIMLGINEIGSSIDTIYNKYSNLVNKIRQKQPNAIIFIEGNLHVAKSRNDTDKNINNNRINKLNNKIANLANNQNIFYIDINTYFDDADGNLKSSYTSDATHVYAKYYKDWCEWLKKHGI